MNIPRIILMGGGGLCRIWEPNHPKARNSFTWPVRSATSGLIEVPMGTSVGEIIFDMGGGIPGGKKFKAVQLGGTVRRFYSPGASQYPDRL